MMKFFWLLFFLGNLFYVIKKNSLDLKNCYLFFMFDIFLRGVLVIFLNKKWIGGWICMYVFMIK